MNDPLQFILAGNALFTVQNIETGNRFTFKVRKPDDTKPHFVSVLTGSDNESSYSFLGTVFDPRHYRHGRRSRISEDAPSARAFDWLFRQLSSGRPLSARNLLFRPPHRGRPESGQASGCEGVRGERGAEKGQRTPPMLLRAGNFEGEDVVGENLMHLKHHF
jgi:hypothetical protein